MWDSDPSVMQLPHIGSEIVKVLKNEYDVDSVDHLLSMEDDERKEALQSLSRAQLSDVVRACNMFPEIREISATPINREVIAGDRTAVYVLLEREEHDDNEGDNSVKPKAVIPVASAPRYPKRKEEGWWLVVGDPGSNALLSLKYISLAKRSKVKLDITAPVTPGDYKLELYLISDTYVADCDQQIEFFLKVITDEEEVRIVDDGPGDDEGPVVEKMDDI
jgi:pre-mRNA-splicing helicase BRR2